MVWRRRPAELAVLPEPEPAPVVAADPPAAPPEPAGPYVGPRCYVCEDEWEPDGNGGQRRTLEGGWHYSTRVVTVKHRIEVETDGETPVVREWAESREVPDRKLHLNDEHRDESNWFYEYAEPHHKSWYDKRGLGVPVPLQALEGTHPAAAYDTHIGHEQWHLDQGSTPGRRANG